MILSKLFAKAQARPPKPDRAVYGAIVAAARQPSLYLDLRVPDTVDGRFDMIVLHMFLVLDRLQNEDAAALRQGLTDEMFSDMDRSLREMGVGDLSVGKKVRKMAEVYHGRIRAYRQSVDAGQDEFRAALARNVYAGEAQGKPEALATYAATLRNRLAAEPLSAFLSGEVIL